MSHVFPFLRDLIGLPAYRQALKKAARPWQAQLESFDFAPPYPSLLGWSKRRQLLRLLPKDRAAPVGWTIYLHGGAWTFGKPHDFLAAAQPWIEAGYGVLLPSYRRMPRYAGSDMLNDLQMVLSFVQKQGWLTSGQETQLAGMSSGGHLAALMALSPQIWQQSGWPPPSKVICCGAPLDLDQFPQNAAIKRLRGSAEKASYQATNPHFLLKTAKELPRFLIIHPTRDGMAPAQQAADFYQSLKEKSPNSSILWLENKGHLSAGRWMFEEGEVRETIRQFITGRSAG